MDNNKNLITALLSSINQPTFILDAQGIVLYTNEFLGKKLGKTTDELLGKNIYSFLPKELAEHRQSLINKVFASGNPIVFEDSHNGMYFNNSIYPIKNNDGKTDSVAIFALDITDQKKKDYDLNVVSHSAMDRELKMAGLKDELKRLKEKMTQLESKIAGAK